MSKRAKHFDKFRGQTRLKHFILESYLEAWATVQLVQGVHANAWFIDAFAGTGKDSEGKPGSPLIACRVSRRVSGFLSSRLSTAPVLRVVAIEANALRFRALQAATAEFCGDRGGNCLSLICGSLDGHLDDVIGLGSPTEPKLFFLDPFGVQGLDAAVVRRIFERKRYEALILFADSAAVRLDGAARAQRRPVADARTQAPSLFDDCEAEVPSEIASEVDEAIDVAPANEAILRTAFGTEFNAARALADRSEHPRLAWMQAYVVALHKWKATHVLPFSVVDEAEQHRYYLIHAATHGMATEKFKDAIRRAMNRRAEDSASQTSMLYVSAINARECLEAIQRHFAGQTVRWQNEKDLETIRSFLLRETPALHSDLPRVRGALKQQGWQTSSRPATYAIPIAM